MEFYEVIWNEQIIGDGSDLDEALQSYSVVRPSHRDWNIACHLEGGVPCINRYASFEDYLDNADCLETIAVTPEMISKAID